MRVITSVLYIGMLLLPSSNFVVLGRNIFLSAPAPPTTIWCADRTDRFAVTKPNGTVIKNRSCKWCVRYSKESNGPYWNVVQMFASRRWYPQHPLYFHLDDSMGMIFMLVSYRGLVSGGDFLFLRVLFPKFDFINSHGMIDSSLCIHDAHHHFIFMIYCRVNRKQTWLRCNMWGDVKEACPKTCKMCCADRTDRFAVTKPNGTVIKNRSCKWWVRYSKKSNGPYWNAVRMFASRRWYPQHPLYFHLDDFMGMIFMFEVSSAEETSYF